MATYTINGSFTLSDDDVDYASFNAPIIVNTDNVGRVTICGLDCPAYTPIEPVQREIRAMLHGLSADEMSEDDVYDYLANEIADNYELLADEQANAASDAEHMRGLRAMRNYI